MWHTLTTLNFARSAAALLAAALMTTTMASTPQASVATTTFLTGRSGGVGDKGLTPNVGGAFCQSSGVALGAPGRVTDYVSF